MHFTLLHPRATADHLGIIPSFLSEDDPRPAREQLNASYQHGGGWSPMKGWRMNSAGTMRYTGDPPCRPIAEAKLREETIRIYESVWVSIVQPDGSFEVARMD